MNTVFENDRIKVEVDTTNGNVVIITDKEVPNTKIHVSSDASGLVAESHEWCHASQHGDTGYLSVRGMA